MAAKKDPPAGEAAASEDAPKKGKLKLILIALAALTLLAAGGGAAAYFLLGLGKPPVEASAENEGGRAAEPNQAGTAKSPPPADAKAAAAKEKPAEKPADKKGDPNAASAGAGFVAVPALVVNLRDGGKPRFLRLSVSLELADGTQEALVKSKMPKITDVLQMFLRTKEPDAFSSVSSLMSVRSEMLMRVNQVDEAIKIKSVLLQELMIQ